MTPDELRKLADEATPGLADKQTRFRAEHQLLGRAPDLAWLCAELGEALIPARDLLANDLEREEDGGYRAVLEVVDEALAKLSELKSAT